MTAVETPLLNRYRRIRLLGSGGFGAVYMAQDLRLGRTVAIKEMDADRLGPDEQAIAEQMFEHEARMLASLDHPGLTRVWDFFQIDRRAFLVMEYVPGHTLREALNRRGGPLDEPFVAECALQLCDVLHYLHTRKPQVIFRDLKPANVMVVEPPPDTTGSVSPEPLLFRLIDFGIARLFKPDQTGDTLIIGTPGYASPEQYGQGQTDVRSDIYSLGATLHHLLSGQMPTSVPPPPLATLNPAVSPALAQIVARATATDPNHRYQTVEAMRHDVLALRAGNAPQPYVPPTTDTMAARVATPAPAPTAKPRVTTPLPLADTTPRRPSQSSGAMTGLVVLVVLGIAVLGTLGLRAFGGLGGTTSANTVPTAPPASKEWLLPGATGRLAFGQRGTGGFDLWMTMLDGRPPEQLTNDQLSFSPAWSPDGNQLSVTHDKDIYIGTARNPLFRRLDLGGRQARYPAWSPDTHRMAMATSSDGHSWKLTIVDLDSGAISFPAAPENIGGLTWAPGQRLAFTAPAGPGQPQDIFVLDANGTAINITATDDREEDLPAWSPDSRHLIFTASPAGANNLDQRQIMVMNSDGSGSTQLTAGSGPHTNAVWSPDGRWIAYLAKENSPDWQVWAMRADGSAPRVISFSPARKFYLSWGK